MMRRFTLTDLNNRSGEIIDAAQRGPVSITKRGKPSFVLLRAEDYERLHRPADPRRAYSVDDVPPALAQLIVEGMERIERGEGHDDDE